jgi:hypothetical protein
VGAKGLRRVAEAVPKGEELAAVPKGEELAAVPKGEELAAVPKGEFAVAAAVAGAALRSRSMKGDEIGLGELVVKGLRSFVEAPKEEVPSVAAVV